MSKWTEETLTRALQERFAAPAYAFLPQVRNGTGYSRQARTADALAMSLWPSRGLHLHGFEVKVSRSDWLAELKAPEKADEIARFCHRWWLVVSDPKIVEEGELPPTWGMIAPRGKKLVVIKDAPVLEAQAPTHLLLAALLRRTAEATANLIHPSTLEAEIERRVQRQKRGWLEDARLDHASLERAHGHLKRSVEAFEERSGVKIDVWNGRRIGEAFRVALAIGDVEAKKRELGHTAERLEKWAAEIREATQADANTRGAA